jgi:hypothetical protein
VTSLLPPIPPSLVQDRAAGAWLREVARRITAAASVTWGSIDFTTSSLSDITTRPHSALTSILGADNTSTDATQNKHVSNADMKAIQDRKSGSVAQVVNVETGAVATGTTVIPLDDTIPQNTEGDQYMSLAITPKSSTSTLLIDVVIHMASTLAGALVAALFQDATASALATAIEYQANTNNVVVIGFRHKMTSGTTSATTFKVRAGNVGANTTTFNGSAGSRQFGGVLASSITITEIYP